MPLAQRERCRARGAEGMRKGPGERRLPPFPSGNRKRRRFCPSLPQRPQPFTSGRRNATVWPSRCANEEQFPPTLPQLCEKGRRHRRARGGSSRVPRSKLCPPPPARPCWGGRIRPRSVGERQTPGRVRVRSWVVRKISEEMGGERGSEEAKGLFFGVRAGKEGSDAGAVPVHPVLGASLEPPSTVRTAPAPRSCFGVAGEGGRGGRFAALPGLGLPPKHQTAKPG